MLKSIMISFELLSSLALSAPSLAGTNNTQSSSRTDRAEKGQATGGTTHPPAGGQQNNIAPKIGTIAVKSAGNGVGIASSSSSGVSSGRRMYKPFSSLHNASSHRCSKGEVWNQKSAKCEPINAINYNSSKLNTGN